jgi:uncharacterized membrane protein
VLTTTLQARYASAFPPASELERYEALQPGFADRLLANWEAQGRHRMDLESRVIAGDMRRADLGLVGGFVIVLATIACGTYLIATGKDAAGLTAVITALVGLVGAFAYGTYRRGRERGGKQG